MLVLLSFDDEPNMLVLVLSPKLPKILELLLARLLALLLALLLKPPNKLLPVLPIEEEPKALLPPPMPPKMLLPLLLPPKPLPASLPPNRLLPLLPNEGAIASRKLLLLLLLPPGVSPSAAFVAPKSELPVPPKLKMEPLPDPIELLAAPKILDDPVLPPLLAGLANKLLPPILAFPNRFGKPPVDPP